VTNGNPVELSLEDGADLEHVFMVGFRFENNSHIIAAFGDSLTWGVGDENADESCARNPGGYPERIAVRLKAVIPDISIRNEAVCGSSGAVSDLTFIRGIRRHNPGYALIMYGTNDVLFFEPEETLETLYSMILFSRQEGVFPILGLPPITPIGLARSERILALNVQITDLANREGVPVADVFSRFGTDVSLFSRDGVHPTPAGYERMQDVWYDALIHQPLQYEFTPQTPLVFFDSTDTTTPDPAPNERMYPWSSPLEFH
jgi:lysophospholipase L1-like esterase